MSGPGLHSPMGASGIKRVLEGCYGSVNLSRGCQDNESEHAAIGTAAHAVLEACLRFSKEAWTYAGLFYNQHVGFIRQDELVDVEGEGIEVTREMAIAVQVMLAAVRLEHPDRNQSNSWVERRFHCPTIHDLFYGTSDFLYLDEPNRTLHVWDYKNGAGVIVEVERNPQTMYYACGAIEELMLWDKLDTVVLHIVQPNGHHHDGPVRDWSISINDLVAWLEDELIVGMNTAMTSDVVVTGSHCQFCPARSHACPALMTEIDELEELMELATRGADALTNEQVARILDLGERFSWVKKAALETAFTRLNAGNTVPGWKLANAKSNRIYNPSMTIDNAGEPKEITVEDAARIEFGQEAFTKPSLKSPAQLELLPKGKGFTAQWAYKPPSGLTVVRAGDARPEVSRDTKSLFTDVTLKALPAPANDSPLPDVAVVEAPAPKRRGKPINA